MTMKDLAASLSQALGIPQSELAAWFGINRSNLGRLPNQVRALRSPKTRLLHHWLSEWNFVCLLPLPHTQAEPPPPERPRPESRLRTELEYERIQLVLDRNRSQDSIGQAARAGVWLQRILQLPEMQDEVTLRYKLESLQRRNAVSGNPAWQDAYRELEIRHLTEKIDFLRQLEG